MSREKVMRINTTITKEKMPRSFIKFSQPFLRKCIEIGLENLYAGIGA